MTAPESQPEQRATILIVEDELLVALELKDRITRAGHSVVGVVASGREAIERARAAHPEIVLMDIKLQGDMDGIEAAAAIREQTDAAIIYLTAFADDETIQRARVTQPHGYILKPFNERELEATLEVSLYRHQAERALRDSELWRMALLRSVGDAVIATDAAKRVKFMNPNAEQLTGWTEAEATGVAFEDVFETVEVAKYGGAWSAATTHLVRKDGSLCPIELELTAIREDDTEEAAARGMVCVCRDVSESQRARERERFLAVASSEISSSLDRDVVLQRIASVIVQWADWCAIHIVDEHGALRIGAFAHRDPAKHVVVTRLGGLSVREPETTEVRAVARTGCAVLANDIAGATWSASSLGLHPNVGFELDATTAIIAPLTARNEIVGTITVASSGKDRDYDNSDVEFVKELGRRVGTGIDNAQLYLDARRATMMRDEVLGLVSHDLEHPLATISVHGEQLLQSPDDPERVRRSASVIRRATREMKDLIDDLLDVTRIGSGNLSIDVRRASTTALVGEARSAVEDRAGARRMDIATDVVEADIRCDPERVLQVLQNVLGYAIDLGEPGGRIRVSGESRGGFVELAATLEGYAIPPEQLDHVFEQYWRAPEDVRRASALGLYVSKGIVEAHGGRMWIESTPSDGTTFRFTIPLARPEEVVAASPEA